MSLRPGALAGVVQPVAQHHRLELLARFEAGADAVLPRPRQVADRFVALVRDPDRRELTAAQVARQGECIAPVRLGTIPRFARDLRHGNDLATVSAGSQLPRQRVAAWTGLVGQQKPLRFAQVRERLEQLGQRRPRRTDKARCSTTWLRNPNRDRTLVNVQTNVRSDIVIHGLPPVIAADIAARRSACGSTRLCGQSTIRLGADLCPTRRLRHTGRGHGV